MLMITGINYNKPAPPRIDNFLCAKYFTLFLSIFTTRSEAGTAIILTVQMWNEGFEAWLKVTRLSI